MSLWPKRKMVASGILIFTAQVTFLLVVMPAVTSRLAPFYNQDRPSDGYYELAENLAAGNGYRFYPNTARTLMREPGYPLLLAGLILTFGRSFAVVKITNVILAFLAAWVAMRISLKLKICEFSGSTRSHLIPPLLLLFYPGTLIAESRGGVEVLFALLIAIVLLMTLRAIESRRSRDFAITGLILGITVLVRSTPVLYPIFLLVYLLWLERRRDWFLVFRNIGVMIVVMVAVLSPWIARNYSLTGRFVATASVLGVSAQAGQYINQHLFEGKPWWLLDREAALERDRLAMGLGYRFEDGKEGYYQTFYNSGDEIRFSKYLFNRVVSDERRHPMLAVRCIGQNIFNFWFAGKTWVATFGNILVQLPYIVLAGIGAVCSLKGREKTVGPILLFIGYVMAVHISILAQARYSIPLIPLMSVLAAIGVVKVLQRLRGGGLRHVAPAISETVGRGVESI